MHPQVCPRFCFVAMFHVERFGRAAFKTVFHFANPKSKEKSSHLCLGASAFSLSVISQHLEDYFSL